MTILLMYNLLYKKLSNYTTYVEKQNRTLREHIFILNNQILNLRFTPAPEPSHDTDLGQPEAEAHSIQDDMSRRRNDEIEAQLEELGKNNGSTD